MIRPYKQHTTKFCYQDPGKENQVFYAGKEFALKLFPLDGHVEKILYVGF